MKVVLLAGGLGTRLAEETHKLPKPLVKIGNLPILVHIMNIYSSYGFKNFIICGGYKYEEIIKFFKHYIDFKLTNKSKYQNIFFSKKKNWKVNIVFTGKKTNTGGRVLKIKNLIKENFFFLTYGDGLADINIKKLFNFHNKKKRNVATITAVKPPGRFGVLKISKSIVTKFQEKVDTNDVWINGGYFVFKKEIFKYIKKDTDSLEKDVLTKITKAKKMHAYKHNKFWQPMDTLRDKNELNKIWKKGIAPWKRSSKK